MSSFQDDLEKLPGSKDERAFNKRFEYFLIWIPALCEQSDVNKDFIAHRSRIYLHL